MKPDSKSTVLVSTVSVACAVIAAYNYHKRKLKDVTEKLSLLRDAERKGRIKAEINLRSTIKRQNVHMCAQRDLSSHDYEHLNFMDKMKGLPVNDTQVRSTSRLC